MTMSQIKFFINLVRCSLAARGLKVGTSQTAHFLHFVQEQFQELYSAEDLDNIPVDTCNLLELVRGCLDSRPEASRLSDSQHQTIIENLKSLLEGLEKRYIPQGGAEDSNKGPLNEALSPEYPQDLAQGGQHYAMIGENSSDQEGAGDTKPSTDEASLLATWTRYQPKPRRELFVLRKEPPPRPPPPPA